MTERTGGTLSRTAAAAALLLAVSLLILAGAVQGGPIGDAEGAADVPLVRVTDDSSEHLWPYTSTQPSTAGATLPINVVVANDATFVRFLLTESRGGQWNVTKYQVGEPSANATDGNATDRVESGVVINGTRVEWTDAQGSDRYTYTYDAASDEGRWVRPTYQLHDGTYLGSRYHVRLYEGGTDRNAWTAIQVHREHWDWFRLRHTVDGADGAQDYLERGFRNSPHDADIQRRWYDNGGALDSDGWVTWIEVTFLAIRPILRPGLALAAGFATGMSVEVDIGRLRAALLGRLESGTVDPRYLLLLTSLGLVVLGVRVAAVTLETSFPALPPKAIAAVFYPLLVAGTPVCAALLSRGLNPSRSALAAAAGFGIGIIADYLFIGVAVVPVTVLIHRGLLLAAVAALAAGGASRSPVPARGGRPHVNRLLVIGAVTWIAVLLIPLLELM